MENSKPVLVTLTSPTAAGKSYLFNYIRDVAMLPCLISTTTRRPRSGEKEGVDYYFIDEEFSRALERADHFAELAIYRGVRYGVTKDEFQRKLSQGLAFLIVEPSGIDHYVKPALEAGALHLKYYVHTDPEVRIQRFKNRVITDVQSAAEEDANLKRMGRPAHAVEKTLSGHIDRLVAMHTEEKFWFTSVPWDRVLFGTDSPEHNLRIIMEDVKRRTSQQGR